MRYLVDYLRARMGGLGRWRFAVLLPLAILAALVALPRRAVAQIPGVGMCLSGVDVICAADGAYYDLLLTIIRPLWFCNRVLIQSSYYLDELRYQLVQNIFLSGYEVLLAIFGSFFGNLAVLALLLALLLVIVTPFLGGSGSPLNIRMILGITLFAPVLISGLAGMFGNIELARVEVGQQIYAAASASGGTSALSAIIPNAADDIDMAVPAYLYPATDTEATCLRGNDPMRFDRRSGGQGADRTYRPDELAALYLYADLIDIHCPFRRTTTGSYVGSVLNGVDPLVAPHRFFEGAPGSASYLASVNIRQLPSDQREHAKIRVTIGLARLLFGLFVSAIALIYYLIQLVFTVAMIALFVAIPIGIIFGLFRKDWSWAADLLRRGGGILQASWVSTFVLGLIFSALITSANERNAVLFLSVSLGQGFFTVYVLFVAFQSLQSGVSAVTGVLGGAMAAAAGTATMAARGLQRVVLGGAGLTVGGAGLAAAGAMGAAKGAAGVAQMATTFKDASTASGSRRYGMLAALGRSERVAKAGDVARSMGMLTGDQGTADLAALRAGQAATKGQREFTRALRGDGNDHVLGADGKPVKGADGIALTGAKAAAYREKRAGLARAGAETTPPAIFAALEQDATEQQRKRDDVQAQLAARQERKELRRKGETEEAELRRAPQENLGRRQAGAKRAIADAGQRVKGAPAASSSVAQGVEGAPTVQGIGASPRNAVSAVTVGRRQVLAKPAVAGAGQRVQSAPAVSSSAVYAMTEAGRRVVVGDGPAHDATAGGLRRGLKRINTGEVRGAVQGEEAALPVQARRGVPSRTAVHEGATVPLHAEGTAQHVDQATPAQDAAAPAQDAPASQAQDAPAVPSPVAAASGQDAPADPVRVAPTPTQDAPASLAPVAPVPAPPILVTSAPVAAPRAAAPRKDQARPPRQQPRFRRPEAGAVAVPAARAAPVRGYSRPQRAERPATPPLSPERPRQQPTARPARTPAPAAPPPAINPDHPFADID